MNSYPIIKTFLEQECIPLGDAYRPLQWASDGGGGVSAQGRGVCTGGVPARGCLSEVYTPRGQTDTYENITFPQLLLRMVNTDGKYIYKTSLLYFLLKPFICYFTSIVEIIHKYIWRGHTKGLFLQSS